jgi:nitric oxide reductase NorQ protein
MTTATTTYTSVEFEELTTEIKITTSDRLYEGLGELITSIAGQGLMPSLAEAEIVTKHFPNAGKLTKRGATKKEETPVETEALIGEGTYTRPNGMVYHSRKWGTTDNADVEVLRKAREVGLFALLYGAPGCGKTALAEATFGEELITILGSGDTEVGDLIGGYVQTPSGGFEWVDGALVQAAEQGRPILIDEIGLIDPKVMSVVYGLIDGRKELVITQNPERGIVKAKEGFYLMGATNPNAPGVRLSEALLSRCLLQAEMTTDYGLAQKLGVPRLAITASQNLYKKQQEGQITWSPQMRELEAFRETANIFGTKFAVENLLASSPENDRAVVAETFARVFGEEFRPAKI